MSELGAAALVEALALISAGQAQEVPQEESLATYAAKIDRVMTRIDWRTDAGADARTGRAYDPRPGAYAMLRGQEVKHFGGRLDGFFYGSVREMANEQYWGLGIGAIL